MAPEQADPNKWGEVTPLTDAYALGVVAYQMLAGTVPFAGETLAVLHAHAYDPPPSPVESVPDLGDDLAAVLVRALAKPPGERYADARALVAALRGVADQRRLRVEQQAEMERLLESAHAARAAGDWLEVQNWCIQVLQLDRLHAEAHRMMEEAMAGLQKERTEAQARQRLVERYAAGEQAREAEQWQAAVAAFEEVVEANPDFRDVQDRLAQVRSEFQCSQWYDEAVAHGEAERWVEACRVWVELLRGQLNYRHGDAAERLLDAVQVLCDRYEARVSQLGEAGATRDELLQKLGLIESERNELARTLAQVRAESKALREKAHDLQPGRSVAVGERVSKSDGKEMVRVDAGPFLYGEDQERVHVDAFWIDRTPVTNAEYARFVAATGRKPPRHWPGAAPPGEIADHPVVYVSWHDAAAYAEWAGKRLPSEQEWEKAARGTDGRDYPWGRWKRGVCNTEEAGIGGTTPVGRYSPGGDSPYGCADMAGNVWEWTASSRGRGFYGMRGGSWNYDQPIALCSYWSGRHPGDATADIGFRCVSSKSG